MSLNNRERVEKIEAALTPQQTALLLMKKALSSASDIGTGSWGTSSAMSRSETAEAMSCPHSCRQSSRINAFASALVS